MINVSEDQTDNGDARIISVITATKLVLNLSIYEQPFTLKYLCKSNCIFFFEDPLKFAAKLFLIRRVYILY